MPQEVGAIKTQVSSLSAVTQQLVSSPYFLPPLPAHLISYFSCSVAKHPAESNFQGRRAYFGGEFRGIPAVHPEMGADVAMRAD